MVRAHAVSESKDPDKNLKILMPRVFYITDLILHSFFFAGYIILVHQSCQISLVFCIDLQVLCQLYEILS